MDKELQNITDGKNEQSVEEKKEFKEVTLKFGKGLVGDEFQGKDGNSYRQIMIPPNEETKQPWQTFVVKSNQVHENQFGKGMWCKLPAEGSTTVTKSVAKGVDEQGKTIWENEKRKVPNTELKAMVEAYKTKDQEQNKNQEKGNSLMDKIEKKSIQAAAKDKDKKEAEKEVAKEAKAPKAPKNKKEQAL